MNSQRNRFWDQQPVNTSVTKQMRRFIDKSMTVVFETRYIGEERWWPVTSDEVARTLGVYENDLAACLEQMLAGETMRSPVAEFRIGAVKRAVDALSIAAL